MLVRKDFSITLSHKLPDGSILVAHFGTELEADTKDVSGLAKQVRSSTYQDIADARVEDPDVDFLVRKVKKAHANARKVEVAEEEE